MAGGGRSQVIVHPASDSVCSPQVNLTMPRIFFEQVIRENLDLGRPEEVQLIFDRRITRRTPGRMRTRIHAR